MSPSWGMGTLVLWGSIPEVWESIPVHDITGLRELGREHLVPVITACSQGLDTCVQGEWTTSSSPFRLPGRECTSDGGSVRSPALARAGGTQGAGSTYLGL